MTGVASTTTQPQVANSHLAQQTQTDPLPASRFSFAQIKANSIWVWDTSVQSVKNACGATLALLKRIAAAVYNFFAPKLEAVKNVIVSVPTNISLKLGSFAYASRVTALEAQLEQARRENHLLTQENIRLGGPAREEVILPILQASNGSPTQGAAAQQTSPAEKEPSKPLGSLSFWFNWNHGK